MDSNAGEGDGGEDTEEEGSAPRMPFSRIPASPVDKNIIVVTNAQPVERER
jgi:hypothetical protein